LAHNGNSALQIGLPKAVVLKLTASYIRFARDSQHSLATLTTKQKTCEKRTPHLCFYSPVRRLDQTQTSGEVGRQHAAKRLVAA